MNLSEKIVVIERTLDWMDAHPEKTITGTLARCVSDGRCRPQHERADSFCFLGRLIVEAGPEEKLTTNTALERWFEDFYVRPGLISYVNDQFKDPAERLPYIRKFMTNIITRIDQ